VEIPEKAGCLKPRDGPKRPEYGGSRGESKDGPIIQSVGGWGFWGVQKKKRKASCLIKREGGDLTQVGEKDSGKKFQLNQGMGKAL